MNDGREEGRMEEVGGGEMSRKREGGLQDGIGDVSGVAYVLSETCTRAPCHSYRSDQHEHASTSQHDDGQIQNKHAPRILVRYSDSSW